MPLKGTFSLISISSPFAVWIINFQSCFPVGDNKSYPEHCSCYQFHFFKINFPDHISRAVIIGMQACCKEQYRNIINDKVIMVAAGEELEWMVPPAEGVIEVESCLPVNIFCD